MLPTVTSTAGPYATDGDRREWPFEFRIASASQLRLVITGADGVDRTVLPAELGFTGLLDDDHGGTVTYPLSGPALVAGQSVTVVRQPTFDQPVDLQTQDRYSPEQVEAGLNHLEYQVQYLNDLVALMPRLSRTLVGTLLQIPYARGKLLGWADADTPQLQLYDGVSGGNSNDAPTPASITTLYARDLGLPMDGVSDIAVLLNRSMEEWSPRGGVVYDLRPDAGGRFFAKYLLRVLSGCTILFSGPPLLAGAGGGIRFHGEVAERPAGNLYRLVADATAGDSFISFDTGPQGGGPVSTHAPVGTRGVVRGKTDRAGNSLERQEILVTGHDDGLRRLLLAEPLEFSFKLAYPADEYEAETGEVDRTYISLIVESLLTADAAEGSDIVTVASVADFVAGDTVLLWDRKKSSDQVAGGSSNLIREEVLTILELAPAGANTVRLDRAASRTYEVSWGARLTRFEPCKRAAVFGASLEFTETPTDRVHPFEAVRAVNCHFVDCEVSNDDAFGTRGNHFRFFYALNCTAQRPTAKGAKHLGSGDGYLAVLNKSARCHVVAPELAGGRHLVLFQGATLCTVVQPDLADDRLSGVDWHALGEVECHVIDPLITGGFQSVGSSRTAFKFGNTAHLCGPYRCGVFGGVVSHYRGSGSRVFEVLPGAEECFARGVQCDDIETLLRHSDSTVAPTLLARRFTLDDVVVNGWSGLLVDVDGSRNGSTTRTLEKLVINRLRAWGGTRLIEAKQVNGLRLVGLELDGLTPDLANPYVLKAVDVLGLEVMRAWPKGAARFVALTGCVGFRIVRCDVWDQTETVVLQDNGGNTNGVWHDVNCLGFAPTVDTPGSASTGLVQSPLPIGAAYDLLSME